MCCIFTCCGWIVDLIQRVWVFLMSCVIGSAVCCVLITSSMSGVALGYNYSLAEYIETKETNVSVYLKRGVFDDEVSQDMEWRRRGHKSLNPLLKDDGDLKTAAPDSGPDEVPFRRSNRRLEDSIIDTDAKNNFEGSLMKLTVKPPYSKTTRTFHTNDEEMLLVHSSYTPGSLDEIKGIQGLINKRKMKAGRESTVKAPDNHGLSDLANYPGPMRRIGDRRMMGPGGGPTPTEPVIAEMRDVNDLPRINPARYAVPDSGIGSPGNWFMPKMDPEAYRKRFDVPDDPPPYPSPVTIRPSTIRPPKPTSIMPHLNYQSSAASRTMEPGLITDDMDVEKFRQRNKDFLKHRPGMKPGVGSDADYYDDDVKGIPIRKRRSIYRENEMFLLEIVTEPLKIMDGIESSEKNSLVNNNKMPQSTLNSQEMFNSKLVTTLPQNQFKSKLSQILNLENIRDKVPTCREGEQISITVKQQENVASKGTSNSENHIVTKVSQILNLNNFERNSRANKYEQPISFKQQDASKFNPRANNFLVSKVSEILNHDNFSKVNQTEKLKQISTLPQAKVKTEENLQELNHGKTKFKDGKIISDAIKYCLSISLRKFYLLNRVKSTVTNEKQNITTTRRHLM